MPKLKRQRNHLSLMRIKRSIEQFTEDSTESWSEEEYMEQETNYTVKSIDFSTDAILDQIRDLFTLCQEETNTRFITSLVYMLLRYFGHSWKDIDWFLAKISGTTAKTAHKWANVWMYEGFDEFINESRGGKKHDTFWDCYPDLEIEAKSFTVQECSKKEASFTAECLAKFIDRRFYELNDEIKVNNTYVRSVDSCRLDIRRFGARFTANKSRPYFLGHEREDVVQHREQFVDYLIKEERNFYGITDDELPQWKAPPMQPKILIC